LSPAVRHFFAFDDQRLLLLMAMVLRLL